MINFNGKFEPKESFFLGHRNRAIQYGDVLFETLRVVDGKLVFWEDHYLRLMASMRVLRMEIPMNFTMEFLEDLIQGTIKANNLVDRSVLVDIAIFRDALGHYLPSTNDIAFYIEVNEQNSPLYAFKNGPYEVELFRDFYVNADMLSTLNTNSKIINVVGSIFAQENGYDNCLLLNHEKQVVGALNGNLFLVNGITVKTAPLKDGCLNGIVRKKTIDLLKSIKAHEVVETSISPFELQKADELFITNIEDGIIPIRKYRKKEFGTAVAQKLLNALNEASEEATVS